jgi:hypothetical protein
MIKSSVISLAIIFLSSGLFAQLNVVNINFNEFNISPSSLSQLTISNLSGEGMVRVEGVLTNSANEVILTTVSDPLTLKEGINVFGPHNLTFSQFIFSGVPQGEYVKNLHRLPSGAFNYCVQVVPLSAIEEGDEYCQSVDATMDEQMFLINPYDQEVINTSTPVLIWSHTEPFNILAPGEFFRLKLVEVMGDQDATEALVVNTPIYVANYVERHQVQYPFDAEHLVSGKTYAWEVEKVSNGNIIATTEVWSFSLDDKFHPGGMMYVELKKKLDGSIYVPEDDRIYFRYDERYKSSELRCKIYADDRSEVVPDLSSEQAEGVSNAKSSGYNSYELDLKPYKLKKGYYTLEVLNEKNEVYQLKFVIE